MKRSSSVPATFVAAVAATLLTGCSSPREVRRCVDDRGQVLPDSACEYPRSNYGYRTWGTPHWGYGGSISGGYLRGFSATPSGDRDVVTPSGRTISRGGFGGSGGGFGGFG